MWPVYVKVSVLKLRVRRGIINRGQYAQGFLKKAPQRKKRPLRHESMVRKKIHPITTDHWLIGMNI